MEKCFLIKDKSGRAEPFKTTESHIRKYWQLDQLDDNGIKLIQFLDDCDKEKSWQTDSEEIMYLDFEII